MSFLDILDVFSNLLSIGDSHSYKQRRGKSTGRTLFVVLLIIGIGWSAIELIRILDLISSLLFVGVFTLLGLILSFGSVVLTYRLNLIEHFKRGDYLLIVTTNCLIVVSLASFVNRNYGSERDNTEQAVILSHPINGENITTMLVGFDNKEVETRAPRTYGQALQKGDTVEIRLTDGRLGFDFISRIEKLNNKF
ncbi:MAG: hypothetical protein AAF992_17000 [Bacteroidota bacterium]